MAKTRKRESLGMLIGDMVTFIVSLYATLTIRALALPSEEVFVAHLAPFSLLFIVWVLIFFIAGLYDRHTLLIKSKLPQRVLVTHLFNLIIASVFFYAIPYFGVTPKVTLFLYLFVSTVLIFIWRFVFYPRIATQTAIKVVIVGAGQDVDDLTTKIAASGGSFISVTKVIDPTTLHPDTFVSTIKTALDEGKSYVVAVDLLHPDVQKHLNLLYSFIFSGVQFVDIQDLYEDVMGKVPLGLINESWFLEHVSTESNVIYNALKRTLDILIVAPLALLSLFFYPFVWLAIKLEDHRQIFIFQQRVGENEKLVNIMKFRSMSVDDDGAWVTKQDRRITRVGAFIRKTRIDEFPQFWGILRGDFSLIGPRPELPKLVELYKKEIPHYNVRHLVRPGLSGWAQIHHEKPPQSVSETEDKLSYDLYYIKHRSFMLDVKIALQTIKTFLSLLGGV